MTNRDLPLTANEFREILADALMGAAQALRRSHPRITTTDTETHITPDPAASIRPCRLALSMSEAAEALGIGRSMIYQLASSGELPSIHIGKRRLIPVHALDEWIRSLSTLESESQ
jgi:excisionase family DNA binding protein